MRIIGGSWRSRRLIEPNLQTTRPMPDRVKQAVFDMLSVYYEQPGGLPPLNVADVFAGSGTLGLEALSRGAAHCVFFERDPAALTALRKNIADLQADRLSQVRTYDAWRDLPRSAAEQSYDLIFLDPPYRESEDLGPASRVARVLRVLTANDAADPLVILHHQRRCEYVAADDGPWRVLDARVFGNNRITFLKMFSDPGRLLSDPSPS